MPLNKPKTVVQHAASTVEHTSIAATNAVGTVDEALNVVSALRHDHPVDLAVAMTRGAVKGTANGVATAAHATVAAVEAAAGVGKVIGAVAGKLSSKPNAPQKPVERAGTPSPSPTHADAKKPSTPVQGDSTLFSAAKAVMGAAFDAAADKVRDIRNANEKKAKEDRARLMNQLMAQRYDASWMPRGLSENVKTASADPKKKRFRVEMKDGGKFSDYGDRLSFSGKMTDAAICDMTRYAAQHRGWTAVALAGSEQFKEKASIACALAEPPITVHGHTLSGTAATAVENTLKARKAAQAAVEAADATGNDPAATAALKSGDPLKVRAYGETLIRKTEEARKNAPKPEPTNSSDQAPSAPKPKGS